MSLFGFFVGSYGLSRVRLLSAMIMALTLMRRGVHRELVLFDTFEGMTEPGEADRDIHDRTAGFRRSGHGGIGCRG